MIGGIPKVLVVMGSDSDFEAVEPCFKLLGEFGVMFEAHVCSAHRSPDKAAELAKAAEAGGFGVIVAAAGKAAHLPGVLAAYTPLPVIGLPVKSPTLDGLDSLLSIVQMPPGIPVATVAIGGAENAALLAVQILSAASAPLRERMKAYKRALAGRIEEKDAALRERLRGYIAPS
ncbi:MAG: 5-(carboxyamino)imidazole ribonucleotide mutase [Clostridiales bacterium]|jgi:5-(carboxyamino)imidazole ribonucleotide mutase|nr:5-(carboxyamino)imidazole ribonucleotide mutase [Clostridiales bacterium]